MNKKCLGALSLLLACGLFLASCSGKDKDSSSKMTSSDKTSSTVEGSSALTSGSSSGANESSQTVISSEASSMTSNPNTASKPVESHPNVPSETAQIGSPNFKPGSLYKGPVLGFRKDGDNVSLGAWWWVLKGIIEPVNGVSVDMILDMLIANKVNEIYLDASKMLPYEEEIAQGGITDDDLAAGLVSERHVRGFVKKCAKYGIKVAALTGAANDSVLRWTDPANNYYYIKDFVSKIDAYQTRAKADEKFYAIHLDVEPHTMDKWESNRAKYTQWLADFTVESKKLVSGIGLQFEFDIWAWFRETDTVKDSSGKQVNILDIMTKQCDSLGIMSYYNSGLGQYQRATDLELEYAKKNNCKLISGTETIKLPERNVTYYYAGKDKLITEQAVLRQEIDKSGYSKMGGAIHHVYSMYELLMK